MAPSRKKAQPLAPHPGESAMLSAVIADPADDDVKLVYSDWLEERDDPRGPYLRRFVRAVGAGKKPPAGRGVPAAWQEMAGLTLLRRLCAAGLGEYRPAILGLARPALALSTRACPGGRMAAGATRFGGRPDLPPGSEWPHCDRGPLEFLAQLNLADFRDTFAGRALPPEGRLSFFMFHNYPEDEYGDGREEPPRRTGGLRVLHTADASGLTRLDPPDDLTEDLGRPRKPCRVTFREALDLPEPDDAWSDRYGLGPAQLESLRDAGPSTLRDADHQLFGYAHVTVLLQDPIPGPDWQLLVRFSSDDRLGWGWGDGHHLFWYVKAEDLERGSFEGTRAIDG